MHPPQYRALPPHLAQVLAPVVSSDLEVTYPLVHVHLGNLRGQEGNAHVILGRVAAALSAAGIDPDPVLEVARSGNYEFLLQTIRSSVLCTEDVSAGVAADLDD